MYSPIRKRSRPYNAKLFSISFNTSINRNRTFDNKRVKRARLELVDEKNESKQKNNDDEKSASRERSIENENDDATNDVERKKKMMIISMRMFHATTSTKIRLVLVKDRVQKFSKSASALNALRFVNFFLCR